MPSLDDGAQCSPSVSGRLISRAIHRSGAQAVVAVVGVVPVQRAIVPDVAGVVGRPGTKKQGVPHGLPIDDAPARPSWRPFLYRICTI